METFFDWVNFDKESIGDGLQAKRILFFDYLLKSICPSLSN